MTDASEGRTGETPSHALFAAARDTMLARLDLVETRAADGGPHLTLFSHAPFHQGPCGQARVWSGGGLHRAVAVSIVAPAIGLDTHMLFAFAPSGSAVPHFTVDSVTAGGTLAFHLDLIPRLDLATHLGYMDWAYGPLTETFTQAAGIEGLTPAMITPRQRAVMSPWMIVNRATPDAFDKIGPLVATYQDHWLSLLREGAPAATLEGATRDALRERDRRNKAIIFDPDVDKVWNQIRGLIGSEAVEAIRGLLLETGD
jgi:hypothetical protein